MTDMKKTTPSTIKSPAPAKKPAEPAGTKPVAPVKLAAPAKPAATTPAAPVKPAAPTQPAATKPGGGNGGGSVAPTAAGEVFRWRWQTTGNAGTATYWTIEEHAANVQKATGGRVILDAQPSGAIVGTMEIFDAVSTGAIECGSS